ncbi:FAD-binding domain-containing protein [Zopfia rhizophila CBS 207.26]|uniref:FAD-binding domain-containing protein n=1 Tax=Zopfia rhizophila CBS 207.26 TaxID=1314779 RepID=A0A6A6DR74_9PEZI|nr:FAD-binding domain-containing protein [Zopfia rhizophila CBS 207.26]
MHAVSASNATCRCFPGDPCWPTLSQWNAFNDTLCGKLAATTPIAAVCHDDRFASYSAQTCDELRNVWFFPETHLASSSSAMAALFTNNSCNPFLPPNVSCTLGNYVTYAVKATDASDFQKTIDFTRQHNIRLVIRNTGHDYNGKSTGAGAVAIWTMHMKSIELKTDYNSSYYSGRAIKVGAGVSVSEAYEFADMHNGLVVGGNCQTVGLAGGLTQGGGHSPLASKFGLASDQVLEWEVVTGTGQLLTATPNRNSDLYWALCGGGGGTYGAVVSMTAKLHPAMIVSASNLTFAYEVDGSNADQFYDVIQTLIESLPDLVDVGATVYWTIVGNTFSVFPATAPGLSKAELDVLFKPTLSKLEEVGIPYRYYSQEFSTFLQSYQAMNIPSNVSDSLLAGRMLPRSLIENDIGDLISAIRSIAEAGVVFVGVSLNVANVVSSPSAVAANPYWRQTLVVAVFGTFFNYTDRDANYRNQDFLTDDILPELERLTPNGAAYLNEANFQQPDFQSVLYGRNYNRLDAIKGKYDPDDIFYALTAVGSDRWIQKKDGRLCMT